MKRMQKRAGAALPAIFLAMGLTCMAAGTVQDGAIPSPAKVESGVTYVGKETVDDWSLLYTYQCEDAEKVFNSYRVRLDSMADFRATAQDKLEEGETTYARVWYDYTGDGEVAGIYEEDAPGEDAVLLVWVVGQDEIGLFTSMDITFMEGSPEVEESRQEAEGAPVRPEALESAMQPEDAGSALQPESGGSGAQPETGGSASAGTGSAVQPETGNGASAGTGSAVQPESGNGSPAGNGGTPQPETESAPADQGAGSAASVEDDGPSGHWEYQTVQEDCPFCYGGSCKLCNGTGTYRMYGQEVPCDRNCSACDGSGYLERTEYVYVAD